MPFMHAVRAFLCFVPETLLRLFYIFFAASCLMMLYFAAYNAAVASKKPHATAKECN